MSWNDRVASTEWCVCLKCGKVSSYLAMWQKTFAPEPCHKYCMRYNFTSEQEAVEYLHSKTTKKR